MGACSRAATTSCFTSPGSYSRVDSAAVEPTTIAVTWPVLDAFGRDQLLYQVLHWFRPDPPTRLFDPERFPIFICESAPDMMWYGFPDTGDGVKVAIHHHGGPADPETLRRSVTDEEAAPVEALLRRFMPAALGPRIESAVCMYTNTPDHHFIIDAHPAHPDVLLVSPCSGHGFKFSTAVGEVVADLVTGTSPRFDLSPFAVGRFGAAGARAGAAGRRDG